MKETATARLLVAAKTGGAGFIAEARALIAVLAEQAAKAESNPPVTASARLDAEEPKP